LNSPVIPVINSGGPPRSSGGKPRRRGCLIVLAALLVTLGVAFFARETILPAFARCWVIDEKPEAADAILVLGGNPNIRGSAAARLFQQGIASHILITSPELSEVQKRGIVPPEVEVTRSLLIKMGVSADAIQILAPVVTSTRDEALALKQWCTDHHASRVVIPTDLFHSRRVHWIMERTLAGNGTDIRVIALDQPSYSTANWWKSEDGLIAFQNEVIKLLYYKSHY
jgi:uncharacterized SAM-binding protein YcdF (DUF218 family)